MHLCLIFDHQLARPMCMVPNIPGIPGPPLGGSSSGSNSPSGYSIHSEAKMVSTRLALYFYLFICSFCLHLHPPAFRCTGLGFVIWSFTVVACLCNSFTWQHSLQSFYDSAMHTQRFMHSFHLAAMSQMKQRVQPLFMVFKTYKLSPLAHSSVYPSPSLLLS